MTWIYQLFYHLKTTQHNIREHWGSLLLSLSAVGFTMLLLASYLLFLANLQAVAKRLGDQLQVVVYLEKGLSERDCLRLKAKALEREEIESVRYCSPKQALVSLKKAMGESAKVLKNLPENPLPASLEIHLKEASQNLDMIRSVSDYFGALKGVTDVEYGGKWIERFFAFVRILRWLSFSLGLLLLFATVIVISSTLTLGFYARKEEIGILRLVGATESFIRLPFFLEALIQGIGGTLLAIGLLWVLYQIFRVNIGESWNMLAGWVQLHFLALPTIFSLILLGAFIGIVSSLISFVRFSSP